MMIFSKKGFLTMLFITVLLVGTVQGCGRCWWWAKRDVPSEELALTLHDYLQLETEAIHNLDAERYSRFSRRCIEQDTGWVDQISNCLGMSAIDFQALSADWYQVASHEMCGMQIDLSRTNQIRRVIKKHRVCRIATDYEDYDTNVQTDIINTLIRMQPKVANVNECIDIENNRENQYYIKMCLVSMCLNCITLKFNRLKMAEVYAENDQIVHGESWEPYYKVMMYPFFITTEITPGQENPYFRGTEREYSQNNFKQEVKGCIDKFLKPYLSHGEPTVEFLSEIPENENLPQIATTITLPSSLPSQNWYSVVVNLPCKPLWFSLDNAYCVSSKYNADGKIVGNDRLTLVQSDKNNRNEPITVHLYVADTDNLGFTYAEDVCTKSNIPQIERETQVSFNSVDPLQLLPAVKITDYYQNTDSLTFKLKGNFIINTHVSKYLYRGQSGDELHSIFHAGANNPQHENINGALSQILETSINDLPVYQPNKILQEDLIKLASEYDDIYNVHIPESCSVLNTDLTSELDHSLVKDVIMGTNEVKFMVDHERVIERDEDFIDFMFVIEMDCTYDVFAADNWWVAMFKSLFYNRISVHPPILETSIEIE